MSVVARAIAAYRARWGAPSGVAYAPGRVNLIGEHTDYNDGFVLPCAIDRGTAVAFGHGDGLSTVVSADFSEADAFDTRAPFVAAPGWRAHVRGVAAVFADRALTLPPMHLAVAGDVPQGAGLSSSASLAVALGGAFSTIGGFGLGETDIALIAQASENRYVGTACGNMDQLAAAHGRAGKALMIDCRSLSVTPVAMPDDVAVLIVHSGITRGLVDSAYNERRAACEAAAAAMGVDALRDATPAMVGAAALDSITRARARHVVSENARVGAFAAAVSAQDWGAIAALMAASHASMRDDFAITLPPIDALVEALAQAAAGRGGARMTGGGFGGCVVALAAQDRLDAVRAAAVAWFAQDGRTSPLIHACRPAAGLRVEHI
jgi:galactokinase